MRRVTEHKKWTLDREELTIITIYEQGIRKRDIKKESWLSKKHQFLVERGNRFKLIQNRQ